MYKLQNIYQVSRNSKTSCPYKEAGLTDCKWVKKHLINSSTLICGYNKFHLNNTLVIYDFRQHYIADLILAQISTLGWYQSLIFIQSWDDTTCLSKRSLQQFSCFSSLKQHVAFYNTCTVLMKLNNVCDHHPIQIQKLK